MPWQPPGSQRQSRLAAKRQRRRGAATRPKNLPHATLQAIADTAAQYDKLSLAELSQLLFDRQIYRARDRKSGEEKPVNRGTLTKWLEQARRADLL